MDRRGGKRPTKSPGRRGRRRRQSNPVVAGYTRPNALELGQQNRLEITTGTPADPTPPGSVPARGVYHMDSRLQDKFLGGGLRPGSRPHTDPRLLRRARPRFSAELAGVRHFALWARQDSELTAFLRRLGQAGTWKQRHSVGVSDCGCPACCTRPLIAGATRRASRFDHRTKRSHAACGGGPRRRARGLFRAAGGSDRAAVVTVRDRERRPLHGTARDGPRGAWFGVGWRLGAARFRPSSRRGRAPPCGSA